MEPYEYEGVWIRIEQDQDAGNPREEWDNACKLVLYSRNHTDLDELGNAPDPSDFANWEELHAEVMRLYPGCEFLPVYKYEHSGVAYRTSSEEFRAFDSVGWDWGMVGFILCTRETMLYEWGKARVTKAVRQKARNCMASEVETYSQWANGEVYGYAVYADDTEEEELDSCWGFYGLEYCQEQAEESACRESKDLPTKEQRQAQRDLYAEQLRQEQVGQLRMCMA